MKNDFNKSLSGKQKGFSLIELIIVMLIIAIIAVISVPKVNSTLGLYRVQTVSSLTSDRLMEAKLTAVKHNRPAWLEIDQIFKTIKVFTTNNSNQTIQKGATVTYSGDVQIAPGSSTTVVFNSSGRNQSTSNSTIMFTGPNNRYCVNLTISVVGKTTTSGCLVNNG